MGITEMSQTIPPRVLATDWLPLSRAALCLTCETVFPLAAIRCPSCGGEACMPLATWLKTAKGAGSDGGYQPRPLPDGMVPLPPPRKP
jgi:hypothetical protein